MSSCDEALANYHLARHEFETTQAMLSAFGVVVTVATAAGFAAIITAIVAIGVLAPGPQASLLVPILIALMGVATLASIAALLGYAAAAFYMFKLLRLSQRMDQAYAEVLNKCQGEPDRIPGYGDDT